MDLGGIWGQREEPHPILVSFPDCEKGEHHSASAETWEWLSGIASRRSSAFVQGLLSLTACSLPSQTLVLSPTFPTTFSLSKLHLKGLHCLKYVYLGRKSAVRSDILAGANPPDGLQQQRVCVWLGFIPPALPASMFLILESILTALSWVYVFVCFALLTFASWAPPSFLCFLCSDSQVTWLQIYSWRPLISD